MCKWHQNHRRGLEGLLKPDCWLYSQSFRFSGSGLRPSICISNSSQLWRLGHCSSGTTFWILSAFNTKFPCPNPALPYLWPFLRTFPVSSSEVSLLSCCSLTFQARCHLPHLHYYSFCLHPTLWDRAFTLFSSLLKCQLIRDPPCLPWINSISPTCTATLMRQIASINFGFIGR